MPFKIGKKPLYIENKKHFINALNINTMITLTRNQAIATGVLAGIAIVGTGTVMYFVGNSKGQKKNIDKESDRLVKKVTSKFEEAIKKAVQDNIGDAAEMLGSVLSPKKDNDPDDTKKKAK